MSLRRSSMLTLSLAILIADLVGSLLFGDIHACIYRRSGSNDCVPRQLLSLRLLHRLRRRPRRCLLRQRLLLRRPHLHQPPRRRLLLTL